MVSCRALLLSTLVVLPAAACGVGGAGGAGRDAFEAEVVPVLERDCGTNVCHAAEGDRFDTIDPTYFAFPVDDQGRISGDERIDRAYQRSLEKLSAQGAQFADLIRKPLDESLGGLPHRGGSQYRTMADPALEVLIRWADEARPTDAEPLPPLAQRYRDEIEPILEAKRCMLSSCHGASSANFLKLDPGFLGEQDDHGSLHNYEFVAFFLAFESPDPMQSRLIRKTIPQDQGGIFHRGGNAFFDPSADDPDLATIVDFVTDARSELGDADKGQVSGLLFAAADPTPRRLFDISAWQPGGDLYSLIPAVPGGTVTNITAGLHTEPADIRDPALSYDGTRVAFAMRRSQDDCLNLYVMDLDGTDLVQLTHDSGTVAGGAKVASVQPLWGPDDRIYFVSSRDGEPSAHDPSVLRSNVWRIDADGSNPLRVSFSAGSELAPAWRFFNVPGDRPELRTLDLTFTSARRVGAETFAPLMRVPPDFRSDYHPHYGTQHPVYRVFYALSMFPDFRDLFILADDRTVWEGGALALVDRNLGPVIKDGGDPAVVNYVDSLQTVGAIGEQVAHAGYSSGGYYRDPFALPDGSIVVTHSPAPIDLADAGAAPDPGLYRLEIIDLAGNQIVVSRKELLVDLPGKVEADARPIMVKRREQIDDPTHHLTNGVDWGDVLNFDLAVSLTVAGEDSPSRTKEFDAMAEQIRWVRLVEEIAPDPALPAGRGPHGIRRVIAEMPATSDRSLYARVPAGVPFFIQSLDDTRMATSTFNQWFFVLPGEKLKQVTRREVWNGRCGACHGSRSGVPGETVGAPDVLTQASRVVANYDASARVDKEPLVFGLAVDARTEVDFERDLQPVLSARCASGGCHDGSRAPDLRAGAGAAGFSAAYEALTAAGGDSANGFQYVDPVGSAARGSYLAEVLLGADLDAPRAYDSQGCPGGRDLSLSELAVFMRWMDLGASYRGIGPRTTPALPTY